MSKIVISYRRADAAAISGRLYDRLVLHFGQDSVFIDIDDVPLARDFLQQIEDVVRVAGVVVAVIGPHWLGRRDDGSSRVQDEDDPIRFEITKALAHVRPIIPVFVDGAAMPARSELPDGMKDLSTRNGICMSSGRDFDSQVERLVAEIGRLLATGSDRPRAPRHPRPPSILPAQTGPSVLAATLIGLAVVLVTLHYLLVMKWDAQATFFRVVAIVVPVVAGAILGRQAELGVTALLTGAAVCALLAVSAILVVVGLVDDVSIVPNSRVAWQESAELAGSILLGLVGGFSASRLIPRRI